MKSLLGLKCYLVKSRITLENSIDILDSQCKEMNDIDHTVK